MKISTKAFSGGGGQILPFPIGFRRQPYNTLALPCQCDYDMVMIVTLSAALCLCQRRKSETPLFRHPTKKLWFKRVIK